MPDGYAEEGGELLQATFSWFGISGKLVFENKPYRTIKWERVIELISVINKGLRENKNGTSQFSIEKSHQVARTRFELVSPP